MTESSSAPKAPADVLSQFDEIAHVIRSVGSIRRSAWALGRVARGRARSGCGRGSNTRERLMPVDLGRSCSRRPELGQAAAQDRTPRDRVMRRPGEVVRAAGVRPGCGKGSNTAEAPHAVGSLGRSSGRAGSPGGCCWCSIAASGAGDPVGFSGDRIDRLGQPRAQLPGDQRRLQSAGTRIALLRRHAPSPTAPWP
jgi:hypothetical protein